MRDIIDSAAELASHRDFDSFGNVTGGTVAVVFAFAFTGRPLDADTGLYNYRARWYDSSVGVFISEDPLGITADLNPFRYANNSPLVYVDPSGLEAYAGSGTSASSVSMSDMQGLVSMQIAAIGGPSRVDKILASSAGVSGPAKHESYDAWHGAWSKQLQNRGIGGAQMVQETRQAWEYFDNKNRLQLNVEQERLQAAMAPSRSAALEQAQWASTYVEPKASIGPATGPSWDELSLTEKAHREQLSKSWFARNPEKGTFQPLMTMEERRQLYQGQMGYVELLLDVAFNPGYDGTSGLDKVAMMMAGVAPGAMPPPGKQYLSPLAPTKAPSKSAPLNQGAPSTFRSPRIGSKIQRQMGRRGWTARQIDEAAQGGRQIPAINRATGNPATRYVHPTTGQSAVVDTVTGEVIHVGGPGFQYGPGAGDVPLLPAPGR